MTFLETANSKPNCKQRQHLFSHFSNRDLDDGVSEIQEERRLLNPVEFSRIFACFVIKLWPSVTSGLIPIGEVDREVVEQVGLYIK